MHAGSRTEEPGRQIRSWGSGCSGWSPGDCGCTVRFGRTSSKLTGMRCLWVWSGPAGVFERTYSAKGGCAGRGYMAAAAVFDRSLSGPEASAGLDESARCTRRGRCAARRSCPPEQRTKRTSGDMHAATGDSPPTQQPNSESDVRSSHGTVRPTIFHLAGPRPPVPATAPTEGRMQRKQRTPYVPA